MSLSRRQAATLVVGTLVVAGGYVLYVRLQTTTSGTNSRNPLIAIAALASHAPAKHLKAIALWESDNFKWSGTTHNDHLSHGLTGITLRRAKDSGYQGTDEELNDDWRALFWGGKAFAEELAHAGNDINRALTTYHHGRGFEGVDSNDAGDGYVDQVLNRARKAGLHV